MGHVWVKPGDGHSSDQSSFAIIASSLCNQLVYWVCSFLWRWMTRKLVRSSPIPLASRYSLSASCKLGSNELHRDIKKEISWVVRYLNRLTTKDKKTGWSLIIDGCPQENWEPEKKPPSKVWTTSLIRTLQI